MNLLLVPVVERFGADATILLRCFRESYYASI
jgi:hypothetical protein